MMHFQKRYTKLSNFSYSTIRRSGKWKVGSFVNVIIEGKNDHVAEIISKDKIILKDIDEKFLIADTDEKDKESAINLIKSFYENLTEDSEVYVYILNKDSEKPWANNKISKGKYYEDDECARCVATGWCSHGPKHVPCDVFRDSGKKPKPRRKQINLSDLR